MTKNMKKLVKNITATTSGRGFWSDVKRSVRITEIEIQSITDDNDDEIDPCDKTQTPVSMDLRVYFNRKDWNTDKHGLIYTDDKWIAELRKGLREIGVTATGLDYTEQGMQGDDYVSVCVYKKPKTIASMIKAFG